MTNDQPVTERNQANSNTQSSGREGGLGRRSYLTLAGSAAATLGLSSVASTAVAGDDDDGARGPITVDYDEYSEPSDLYDVNDLRGSHTPEFVTEQTTTGEQALHMEFTGAQKTANCEYRFQDHVGETQDEVYTRFHIYPENFQLNQSDTIRMFWAPLTNGPGSSGGGATDGTNGWSNAIGFANRDNSPAPEGYKFFSYSYHMDNSGSGDFQMTDAVVQMDEWNEIECHIKVNSYENGTAEADGEMRYWVNDELAFEDTTMRFTTSDENGIGAVGPLGYVVGNSAGSLYYDEHEICLGMGRDDARATLEDA